MSAKRTEIARHDATIKQVTEENDRLVALVTELLDIIDRIDVPGLANFVDDLVSRMSDRVYDAVSPENACYQHPFFPNLFHENATK